MTVDVEVAGLTWMMRELATNVPRLVPPRLAVRNDALAKLVSDQLP
ncbi:hypothetical protein [Actinocrispum wychmicini]|nr:hypothetical protein [Actinocrispum wychmicini]